MASTLKISSGDIIVSSASGRPILISEKTKLKQDIIEFFTVNTQPNGFGAGLEQLIGFIDDGYDSIISISDKQIRDGLQKFIYLINSDPRIPRTSDEKIVGISNIVVSKDNTDPTKVYFSVNVITESGLNFTVASS